MFRNTIFLLLFLLVSLPSYAQSERVTLAGYVTDSQTKESLIGVTVQDLTNSSGTVTNNFGYYSLSVPKDMPIRVRFSCIGYATKDTIITISTPALLLDIAVEEQGDMLAEVTVIGSHTSEVRSLETGRVKMLGSDIQKVPSFMGENDIIKYVQLLPGVAQGTEGFSGPVVRGGNIDENLYLLDGNPLYNVNHLGGLFSTFNSDAIKSANFYKGSFPARFGGRLSSVLDVRMKDGDMQEYHGTFSLGLISSKLHLEGPIWKGRTSFSLSLRRTYMDLLVKGAIAAMKEENQLDDSSSNIVPSYYFYDMNAKVNHIFSEKDRLFLSFYLGQDRLSFRSQESHTSRYDAEQIRNSHDVRLGINWGNMLLSLGWNHIFSPTLFANTTLYYGQYGSLIGIKVDDRSEDLVRQKVLSKFGFNFKFTSGIRDIGLRSDFEWQPNNYHFARFGVDAITHQFLPSVEDMDIDSTEEDLSQFVPQLQKRRKEEIIRSTEVAVYGEDEWKISESLSANFGVRSSILGVENKFYFSLEPRVSVNYRFHPTTSLKGSYAEMTQYVHLLQSTAFSLPTDLWVPVTSKIKPMRSRQAVLGLYWESGGYEASVEGYYKWLHNQIAYKDGAMMISSEENWQDRVAIGEGRAYGTEILLRKTQGKLSGWISYTLSWSDRIFPGGEVNNGFRFWDKYDNRHRVNIVAQYNFGRRADISASWVLSSGNRMSLQTEQMLDLDGNVKPFVEQRNNFQLPMYHRLNLSLNFYRYGRKGQQHIWNISVYNAYNQHNSFLVSLEDEYDEKKQQFTGKQSIRSVALFPIIPSVTYTFKF